MRVTFRAMVRVFTSSALVGALALSLACGSKKAPEVKLLDPENVEVSVVGEVGTFTEPTTIEQGIGMHARAMEDGSVVLSIRNKTEQPFDVNPRMFAVITGPDRNRDLIAINAGTADITMFYPESIPAANKGVFRFMLKPAVPMRGKRVVLQDPTRSLLFFTEIE